MTEPSLAPIQAPDPVPHRIPWSMCIYGNPGIGKSTLATHAPGAYFIDLENGLRWIRCSKTKGVVRTFEQFKSVVASVAAHPRVETIVIDTIDQLEVLMTSAICREGGKKTLADFGYGKGYEVLEREWYSLLDYLDQVRDDGKNILFLGHDKVERYEDPSSEGYDRYHVKLHKKSAGVIFARLDAVLFATFEKVVRDKDQGDKKIATATGRRLLQTRDAACWVAKNRFNLEPQMPLARELFTVIEEKCRVV